MADYGQDYGGPSDAMVDAANEAVALRAENARLQARVEQGRENLLVAAKLAIKAQRERDDYKALAERRGEWMSILEVAQQQDIKWKKPMPEIDFGDEAIYVWALKAQEEMGELSAALLGGLIGKEGRGDVLEECYQLIAVLLRVARAALAAMPTREKEGR